MIESGSEADWRADLRQPLPDWLTGPRVEWLRQHRIEQGDRCHYCGVRFTERGIDTRFAATIDHVVPLAAGGDDNSENTVAACWLCNIAKADLMPEQARTLLPHRRVALLNWLGILKKRKKRRGKRKRQQERRAAGARSEV